MINLFNIGALYGYHLQQGDGLMTKSNSKFFQTCLVSQRFQCLAFSKAIHGLESVKFSVADGVWSFDQGDIKPYVTKKQKEVSVC